MGIKVSVNSTPRDRISINSQKRSTVRTIAVGIPSTLSTALGDLTDVDATNPDNNETLVYDATSGKYIIKTLPIVDGGSF